MLITLDVFDEMKLAKVDHAKKTAEILKATERVDLNNSKILNALKATCFLN